MELKDKRILEICDKTRLNNNGQINWQQAKQMLDYEFGISKSWKAWRSMYRHRNGEFNKGDTETPFKKERSSEPLEISDKAEPPKPKKIYVETGTNGTQRSEILVDIVEYPMKTPTQVLELHGYDIAQWELVNHKLKIWNTYSKQDGTSELYSSAITVKPIGTGLTSTAIEELFENLSHKYMSEGIKVELKEDEEREYMLELAVYDVHFGKFAWKKETNNDFDLKIADELYRMTVMDLFEQAKLYSIKKVLIVFGNDFFHYDNLAHTTTGGTKQDTDTRLPKMFEKGCDAIVWTVEYAKQYAEEVDFLYVPSNHDYTLGYFASSMVRRMYVNDPQVTHLYCSPISRKYYYYHNVLLGLAHGDKETKDNIKTVMQSEEPELWAKTYVHEWHLGHFHSEKTESYNSLVIRNLPSITATDLWHYQKGWVGAIQKGLAFLWHESGSKITIESIVRKNLKEW